MDRRRAHGHRRPPQNGARWSAVAAVRRMAPVGPLPVMFRVVISALALERIEAASSSSKGRGPHYPYADLISESVAFCYDRLVKDPSCCVDTEYAAAIEQRTVSRPKAAWTCGDNCSDAVKGQRGDDVLWVPDGADCNTPRVLFVHGGSWEYGSPTSGGYGQLVSKLAARMGAVIMVPDYPLIPVGNYSVILDANLQALRWLVEKGPSRPLEWQKGHVVEGEDCDPKHVPPLFIAGDSAGGGTALSLVLTLAQEPNLLPRGVRLTGAFFFSPWTNLLCNTPDYYTNAFAKIVDTTSFRDDYPGDVYVGDIVFQGHPNQNLDWFTSNAEGYVGNDRSLLVDPVASPYHAGMKEFDQPLPPMYFAVGHSESILGDSVVVAQKAARYGAKIFLDVYTGMWHDFPMYSEGCGSGLPLWQAVRAISKVSQFVNLLASQGPAALDGMGKSKVPHTIINYHGSADDLLPGDSDYDDSSGAGLVAAWQDPRTPNLAEMPLSRGATALSHGAAAACGALGVVLLQALWIRAGKRSSLDVDYCSGPLPIGGPRSPLLGGRGSEDGANSCPFLC